MTTGGPGAMAKSALLVAAITLLASEVLARTGGVIGGAKDHVAVAGVKQPPQGRPHTRGSNANSRCLLSDSSSTINTAVVQESATNSKQAAVESSAVFESASSSSSLDWLPSVQQTVIDSMAGSTSNSLPSPTGTVSSSTSTSSSGSNAVATFSTTSGDQAEEDVFSIFNSPAGQSLSIDSSSSSADSTSSSSSVAEDSSGSDIFDSGDDPMQQLYNTMTWSTTYFNGSDFTSSSITGSSSNTAAVTQESGQYQSQSSSGSTLESAQVALNTPEAQAMYDSTLAGTESPAGGSADFTYGYKDAFESPAAAQASAGSQGQYSSQAQATNQTAPDYLGNLESYQVDLGGDTGLQASTSGYDPSTHATIGADDVAGNVSASTASPKPVTSSAVDIAKAASSTAVPSNNGSTRNSAWMFSDSSGNNFTLELAAPQRPVELGAPVVGRDGMITYNILTPPVLPAGSHERQDPAKPNSTLSSNWVPLQAPEPTEAAQPANASPTKKPIKLGVGSDAAAGIHNSNPYDVTTVGNGGAPLGPGLITGVGVSLAGVFVLALVITVWYKHRPRKLKKSEVRQVKHGIMRSWGIPGQHDIPVVVATAGNVNYVKSYSPVGSPMSMATRSSPRVASNACTHSVLVKSESEPTPGLNLRWVTCSGASVE